MGVIHGTQVKELRSCRPWDVIKVFLNFLKFKNKILKIILKKKVVTRGWGREYGLGGTISFQGDEKILEVDSGDGCTIL